MTCLGVEDPWIWTGVYGKSETCRPPERHSRSRAPTGLEPPAYTCKDPAYTCIYAARNCENPKIHCKISLNRNKTLQNRQLQTSLLLHKFHT